MATKDGVPENTNPFCIATDYDIGDGAFNAIAPYYFVEVRDELDSYGRYICPTKVVSPALTQAEAEELVRKLAQQNLVDSLAVKVDFLHIVPSDKVSEVFIVTCDWDPETGECTKNLGVNGYNW